VEGSCEDSNEPSGSIKCWEILHKLNNLCFMYIDFEVILATVV
jgi:hypothetical protein